MFGYQLISTINGMILSSLELLSICPIFFNLIISEKLTNELGMVAYTYYISTWKAEVRLIMTSLRPLSNAIDRSQKCLGRRSRRPTAKGK